MAAQTSKKPTYYLWKSKDMDKEALEELRSAWKALGFRVVYFVDGAVERIFMKD